VVSFLKWFGRRAGAQSLPAAPLAPEWSRENATDLRKFLTSETGQILLQRGHSLECATALRACKVADKDSPFHVPPQRAAGFSDALLWLESLATIPTAKDAENFGTHHNASDESAVIGEAFQ